MAKATTVVQTEAPLLTSTNQHPAVIEASNTVFEIRKRYDEVSARVKNYDRILGGGAAADTMQRLDARVHHDSAALEQLKLAQELMVAEDAVRAAQELARADISEAYRTPTRAAVADLKKALLAAHDADARLKAVQMQEQDARGGGGVNMLGWQEFGVRLDNWLQDIKALGLDETD